MKRMPGPLIGSLAAITLAVSAAAADTSTAERGKLLYTQHCLACHGADGAGVMPGVSDLTDSAGALAKSDALLLRSLLDGVQRPGALLVMPPKGGNPALTEQDMRRVLTYIRQTFDAERSKQTTGD